MFKVFIKLNITKVISFPHLTLIILLCEKFIGVEQWKGSGIGTYSIYLVKTNLFSFVEGIREF